MHRPFLGFQRLNAALIALSLTSAAVAEDTPRLRFLGEVVFPTGFMFADTEVGGLSGIDYDAGADVFYAISDDRSQINDARFYDIVIDLSDGSLDPGDIAFSAVTTLKDIDGQPFAPFSVDPEAIRFDPASLTLYWTSEGDANALIDPFVREMTMDGRFIRELRTPDKFLPRADMTAGIRNNLAFESLSFSPNGSKLFTLTENALFQDGPAASVETGSPARMLELNVASGEPMREFVYVTEPVAAIPVPPDGFSTNGVVEMLELGPGRFWVVERSFSVGVGNAIRIFLADVRGRSNVKAVEAIPTRRNLRSVEKTLVLDLADLGIALDNIEGISYGPELPSGEHSLILVSDNNFSPSQFTQFLAFAIED